MQPQLFETLDTRLTAIRARAIVTRSRNHVRIARNHAKIILACNEDDSAYYTLESSANVNTNPRIEQSCLTRNRDLFEFYRDFYAGIKSVSKNPYGSRQPN